jgi:hypothetical protein
VTKFLWGSAATLLLVAHTSPHDVGHIFAPGLARAYHAARRRGRGGTAGQSLTSVRPACGAQDLRSCRCASRRGVCSAKPSGYLLAGR